MDTQRDRILRRLQRGPVCGIELLDMHIPRYAARILELRQQGHMIDTQRCTQHEWHKSHQIEYFLIPDVHAGQLTMEVS